MSQKTKCNNARKKAARQRAREVYKKAETAVAAAEYSPTFPGLDDYRRSQEEEKISRHDKLERHWTQKIIKLQPITGILPLFITKNKMNYEATRLKQEQSSAAELKRKFGIRTQQQSSMAMRTSEETVQIIGEKCFTLSKMLTFGQVTSTQQTLCVTFLEDIQFLLGIVSLDDNLHTKHTVIENVSTVLRLYHDATLQGASIIHKQCLRVLEKLIEPLQGDIEETLTLIVSSVGSSTIVSALDGSRCCGTRIRVEMSSGRKGRGGGGGGRNRYSTQDYFGRLPLEMVVTILNHLDDRYALYLAGTTCRLLAEASYMVLRKGMEKVQIWSYFAQYSAPQFRYERYQCELCHSHDIAQLWKCGALYCAQCQSRQCPWHGRDCARL